MTWDAPNQQVVRSDASGPWEEGSGGSETRAEEPSPEKEEKTKEEKASSSKRPRGRSEV